MKFLKKVEKNLTRTMNNLADFVGKPQVFAVVLLLISAWFITGLFVEYNLWFDVIDLVIFVSTFFLLFIVQSSQNADTRAIQDKLDAIIDALPKADHKKEKEEKRFKSGEEK